MSRSVGALSPYFTETVAAGTTSAPVLVAWGEGRRGPAISVAVFPASGATALVEVTRAPARDVQSGAATVHWTPWTAGSVGSDTEDAVIAPITALRCTATGGSVDWEVLA